MSEGIPTEILLGLFVFFLILFLIYEIKDVRDYFKAVDLGIQKRLKEIKEQRILREARLRQAQEVLDFPSVWTCEYCQTVNRGNSCSNCGASRKKVK